MRRRAEHRNGPSQDEDFFADNPPLLMWGCLCVISSVAIWLVTACRLEMPVSTTHSCVGGMIGMAIALRGADAVTWYKDPSPPDKPLPGGFFGVVLSWFLSPVLSGIFACTLFFVVRCVLRSKNPFRNAVNIYPALVLFCVTIITLFMLMKGIKSMPAVKSMDVGVKVGVAFAVGAGVAILFIPAYLVCKKRIQDKKFVAPPLAIEGTPLSCSAARLAVRSFLRVRCIRCLSCAQLLRMLATARSALALWHDPCHP